jgi:Lrp/AsnC family leucine-responsive transcriptional regulator
MKLDSTDIRLLNFLQQDSKKTAKQLGLALDTPVTTVYAKIKRMEELGLIRGYRAILDGSRLGFTATAFVLATFSYRSLGITETTLSQREVAKQVATFPEVQEVHIISGDWDLLIKVRTTDIDAVGKFVVDKLRTVRGIEKTVTCMVFNTTKETLEICLDARRNERIQS